MNNDAVVKGIVESADITIKQIPIIHALGFFVSLTICSSTSFPS
jgi:hypothetical protein